LLAEQIRLLLAGRVAGLSVNHVPASPGKVFLRVQAKLIDPLRKMAGISILLVRRSHVRSEPRPDERGLWGPVARDMQEYPLAIQGDSAFGEITLEGHPEEGPRDYLLQTKYILADHTIRYTQPGPERVDF